MTSHQLSRRNNTPGFRKVNQFIVQKRTLRAGLADRLRAFD
jgi:hypothetical protein